MEDLISFILAGLAIYATVCIIWYIIMVVANWMIFTKAGEAGWKSIIPILNTYVIFKISWKPMMFWIMLATSAVGSLLTAMAGEEGGILQIIGLILGLASGVIGIIDIHKLSKSFGHGIGFTLGMLFLSPLFTLILGYGRSQYQGPDI